MQNDDARKAMIMLVEDDDDHAELTVGGLEAAGVGNRVLRMRNGKEATDYLLGRGQWASDTHRPMPVVILLDLKMPVMDGKQALALIKADEALRGIPVVMLSSSGLDSDIRECYALGANSYIVKPVSFGKFGEVVKSIPLYWLLVNRMPGGD
jgi:CheY-like chemotaxis protein